MSESPGQKAEKLTVKRLRIVSTVASGQLDGDPADGKTKGLRVEIKCTERASIRLDRMWLLQLLEDAVSHGQAPVLSLQFINGDGRPKPGLSWIAVPEYLFEEIREVLALERF